MYEIFGFDRSTPPGVDQFLRVVHPDDRAVVEAESYARADPVEGASLLEFRIVRPDGEERWIARRRSAERDPTGNIGLF